MDGHPTPDIRVGDLLLRPYGDREADDFVRVVSDPGVARWMGDGGPFPPVEALAVFERLQTTIYPEAAWPVWAVVVDGSVQGHAEVKPSPDGRVDGWGVVYALLPAAQGRGLGTELAAALTD